MTAVCHMMTPPPHSCPLKNNKCMMPLTLTTRKQAFHRRALWKHWCGLTLAWGSSTYEMGFRGRSYLRSREEPSRQNFCSTESSSSKGPLWSPARMIVRSQGGTRGGLEGFNHLAALWNLTIRSCFPRDWPFTASWCAAIAATYTFKVEGDSLRANVSCRKESTTPIVHIWGSSRW